MPSKASKKLVYWLSRADRKIQSITKEHLPAELHSSSQMLVLFHLNQSDGITLSELAQRMQIVPSAITGLVQRMENQRLVEKRTSTTDSRTSCLFLTTQSRKLLPQLKQQASTLNKIMQQGFTEQEINIVERWLRFIAQDLDLEK